MALASTEQAALVALLQTRPERVTWPEIMADVVAEGSAVSVWQRRTEPALELGIGSPLEAAASEIARWRAQRLTFLTVLDPDYPSRLRGIHQAPPVLFARGSLLPDDPAVSVVGSRAASEQGLAMARGIATALVGDGVTVVAGLALGIDTEAHRAALAADGRTVAVIGTGINRRYPAANAELHEVIAERGLLLSQFWPDAPPQKHTFLMRNATMSGYGLATVVVEAGEQSGARAQARMAVEHGRPVILTDLVVGRNAWAKALVNRPGVHVAASVVDVMSIVRDLVSEQGQVEDALRLAYC
jgi:DNA processing protein